MSTQQKNGLSTPNQTQVEPTDVCFPQAVNSYPQTAQQAHETQKDGNGRPKSLWFGDLKSEVGSHTVTTLSAFGAMMTRPAEINRLRQDLRAWFTTYIPTWEESASESDLDESIAHYEALDNFLSALVAEGIDLVAKGEWKR